MFWSRLVMSNVYKSQSAAAPDVMTESTAWPRASGLSLPFTKPVPYRSEQVQKAVKLPLGFEKRH